MNVTLSLPGGMPGDKDEGGAGGPNGEAGQGNAGDDAKKIRIVDGNAVVSTDKPECILLTLGQKTPELNNNQIIEVIFTKEGKD